MSEREAVAVPRAAFRKLLAQVDSLRAEIEDLQDSAVARSVEADGPSGDALPDALVGRLLDGEHPLRIWREHRGLKPGALARRAGVGASVIGAIEAGKASGSVQVLLALAKALDVQVEDIVRADG